LSAGKKFINNVLGLLKIQCGKRAYYLNVGHFVDAGQVHQYYLWHYHGIRVAASFIDRHRIFEWAMMVERNWRALVTGNQQGRVAGQRMANIACIKIGDRLVIKYPTVSKFSCG